MSFYVDADDQRQKARWAEQQLLAHDERRPARPPRYDPADDEPSSGLPPVFRKEGYYAASRDTSIERRASRFRDGLPPPPLLTPEMDPTAIPRLLPPSLPPLIPPDQFGAPLSAGRQTDPQAPPDWLPPEPPEPQYRMTAQGLVPTSQLRWETRLPDPSTMSVFPYSDSNRPFEPPVSLTPSQKKRLRRKRKKEANGTAPGLPGPPRPAPFPLAVDMPANGHAPGLPGPPSAVFPTHPEITQTQCSAEVLVRMPNGSTHRLVCPLRPFPHPNQPHMIQLQSAQPDGAEIFIGFWMPGE